MKIQVDDSDRIEMLSFYQAELDKTVRRLQHLKSVMSQLGSETKIEVVVVGMGTEEQPAKVRRSKQPRKRGRQSKWGQFILDSLHENGRPLRYSEIITAAKIRFNTPAGGMKALKASINQSAFRLRTKHKLIDTHGEPGKKEKYLGLANWFENGTLNEKMHAGLK
jgi:hypothetical protein